MDIEDKTRTILNEYWASELPIDVDKLAIKMGLRVQDEVDSAVSGTFDGDKTITINRQNSRVHQRFTLAHEIGHYALGHRGRLYRDLKEAQDLSVEAKQKEVLANRFAAALLMPDFVVEWLIKSQGVNTVGKLADSFGVSAHAMSIRLKHLKWIK